MTETNVLIEPIDPAADLDAIVEVQHESFTNPWTREMFAWELQNSDVSHTWVLRTAETRVAAFCSVWLIFDELHVNNLAVRPAWRRRGLASRLLAFVLKHASERGARRVTLEVRRSNEAAIRLYERFGFHVTAIRRDYYTSPREDALVLWLDELSSVA